ncbi:hypothetical protein BH09BAC1_BH09BAC1_14550 [soil metagenome]
MVFLRLIFAVFCFALLAATPLRAQLVINELSNGTGVQEYVELLVIGTPTCSNSCVDLRGWVIDDNNGTFATGAGTGIAAGHMRFANNTTWQCVPIGTLIVIYNQIDKNPAIPADNATGANCRYILPASSLLFERNVTEPSVGGVATYSGPYAPGGDWNGQGLSNSDDSYQTRAPGALGVPYHAVSYGNNNSNNIIYFAGGGGGLVFFMANSTNNNPALQANWTSGAVATNQTPGAPNNTANATWISTLNNNCTPFTGVTVDLGPDVTICAGQSATVTATPSTAGGTYTWNVAGSGSSVTVTPASTITVTVSYNLGGCIGTDAKIINVNPVPIASITGNTTICLGQSTTLIANGGTSYVWSTSANTQAITVTPSGTTVYTVTVTGANGCTSTASTTVNVNSLPNATITGNTAICSGASTTLTANGGTSYAWSTSAATQSITVSPASNTTYTVTVTDANTCTSTTSATVSVNTATATITGSTTICPGASTTLTATGGTSFSWSTSEITATITVSPANTTTYSVTVTDANSCTATASATVNVSPAVVANITGNLTICETRSTTLTATGGGTYEWSTSATTAAINVSPTTTTPYSVTVTSGNCTGTATVSVTVNPAPIGAVTGTTTICAGASTTLTATGGTSYQWSNSSNLDNITVSPIINTTYTVTVTGANGCLDTVSTPVTVNPVPNANAGRDTTICSSNSARLTATGGGTYVWSTSETTASITVTPAATTDYTVTVTNSSNCTSTDVVRVNVNQNNIILSVDSIWAETCERKNGRIVLVPDPAANFTTYILYNNGVKVDSIIGGGVFFDLTGGTYSITAIDANGCSSSISNIIVPATLVPQATISATTPLCFGDNNGTITLTSTTAGLYYSLNGGTPQQGSTFSGLAAGDYNIRVIDSIAGCDNIINYTLTQPDVLLVTVSPDSSNILKGTSMQLVSSVSGGTTGYAYLWAPSNELDCATCADVTATPLIDSINLYILTVTDTNGCVDSARAIIRVSNEFLVTVPTGFTPNGDSWNDYLRPLANEPITFHIMVFNRWGEKIFEDDGPRGWDGTYKHEQQPMGTYVYVIEYTRLLNNAKGYLTGSITLVR